MEFENIIFLGEFPSIIIENICFTKLQTSNIFYEERFLL